MAFFERGLFMEPTVLLFNFKDENKLAKITRALSPLGFVIKEVARKDYLQPVGCLVGIEDILPVEPDYNGPELEHEMLFIAVMSNSQIHQLLTALNNAGVPKISHKAALTENNQFWNTLQLYKEIHKEYEYFKAQSGE